MPPNKIALIAVNIIRISTTVGLVRITIISTKLIPLQRVQCTRVRVAWTLSPFLYIARRAIDREKRWRSGQPKKNKFQSSACFRECVCVCVCVLTIQGNERIYYYYNTSIRRARGVDNNIIII